MQAAVPPKIIVANYGGRDCLEKLQSLVWRMGPTGMSLPQITNTLLGGDPSSNVFKTLILGLQWPGREDEGIHWVSVQERAELCLSYEEGEGAVSRGAPFPLEDGTWALVNVGGNWLRPDAEVSLSHAQLSIFSVDQWLHAEDAIPGKRYGVSCHTVRLSADKRHVLSYEYRDRNQLPQYIMAANFGEADVTRRVQALLCGNPMTSFAVNSATLGLASAAGAGVAPASLNLVVKLGDEYSFSEFSEGEAFSARSLTQSPVGPYASAMTLTGVAAAAERDRGLEPSGK
jgi:hypothetical protein